MGIKMVFPQTLGKRSQNVVHLAFTISSACAFSSLWAVVCPWTDNEDHHKTAFAAQRRRRSVAARPLKGYETCHLLRPKLPKHLRHLTTLAMQEYKLQHELAKFPNVYPHEFSLQNANPLGAVQRHFVVEFFEGIWA